MSGEVEHLQSIANQHGMGVNQHGGIYIHGQAYDYLKKLEVAAAYNAAKAGNGGIRPNISQLQQECMVSRAFVKTI